MLFTIITDDLPSFVAFEYSFKKRINIYKKKEIKIHRCIATSPWKLQLAHKKTMLRVFFIISSKSIPIVLHSFGGYTSFKDTDKQSKRKFENYTAYYLALRA